MSVPNFGECGATNYIAGEVDKTETEFVVGDGQEYVGGLPYCNPKLNTNSKYDIYVGFASRLDEQVSLIYGIASSVGLFS